MKKQAIFALAGIRFLRPFAAKLLLSPLPLVSACNYCSSYIRPEQFAGLVVDKHIARSNRNTHVVTVQDRGKNYYIETLYADTLNLYNHVALGDSVIKVRGTTAYRVRNPHKDAVYEFNCP